MNFQGEEKVICGTDLKTIDCREYDNADVDMIDCNISTEDMNIVSDQDIRIQGMYNINTLHAEDNIGNECILEESSIEYCMPKDRSIVDINFIWNEIHRTFDNHARGIKCHFKDWKLINSHRRGLLIQLFLNVKCATMKPVSGLRP